MNSQTSPCSGQNTHRRHKSEWIEKRVATFGDGTGADNDAQVYYVNKVTGETAWTLPDEVLAGEEEEPAPLPPGGAFMVTTALERRQMVKSLGDALLGRREEEEEEKSGTLGRLISAIESGGTEEEWREAVSLDDALLLRVLVRTLVEGGGAAKLAIRALVMLQRAWGGMWARLLNLEEPQIVLDGALPYSSSQPPPSWEAFLFERGTSALAMYTAEEDELEDRMVWLMAMTGVVSQDDGRAFCWDKGGAATRLEPLVDVLLGRLVSSVKEEYDLASRLLLCLNAYNKPHHDGSGGGNMVVSRCMGHASGPQLLETLLHDFNECGDMSEDGGDNRWLVKYFSDLFEDSAASTGLHASDMRVLVDIIIRGIQTLELGSPLLPDYLALLSVVLAQSAWVQDHGGYRRSEIAKLLEHLQRLAEAEEGGSGAVVFLTESTLAFLR